MTTTPPYPADTPRPPHPPDRPGSTEQAGLGSDGDRVLRFEAASRRYRVIVGIGALGRMPEWLREAVPRARRAAVFVDAGIEGQAAVSAVAVSLTGAGLEVVHDGSMVVRPTEEDKSLLSVERMLERLAAARLDRGDVVVALGGGVLGDMAGFAAAVYRRGIAWVNCPTTLLSMVDAGVGGKTGVNLRHGESLKKNMVGAFWQPSLVVADVGVLGSLPDRELRCGLAECLKHGMLAADFGDARLGTWTSDNMARLLAREPGWLVELVERNVAVKATVVGTDEREEAAESGGRALLNLGHTFGHVIETLPGLDVRHGEAVALGLVAACAAGHAMGLVDRAFVDRVIEVSRAAGLPTSVDGLPGDDALIALMQHDKKVAGGVLRLIVPCGEGRCRVVTGPRPEDVRAGWRAVRSA
ncbi:MAG: 3-dehydroquinate synthase family protein [Phycisphaerales bacterium]